MKVYQEIVIDIGEAPECSLPTIIRDFCDEVTAWEWLRKPLTNHLPLNGSPACVVLYTESDDTHCPVVSIRKQSGTMFGAIITTREITPNHFSFDEYNRIARRFARDLRKFIKARKVDITIKTPKSNIGLTQIIPRKDARNALKTYLSENAFGNHQFDDDQLHKFTCILSRRTKEKINYDNLERWLVEDLHWEAHRAKKCRDKAELGWDVLRVNKRL